jgi:hypothetical protein
LRPIFLILTILDTGCATAPEWPDPSRPYQGRVRTIPGIIEAGNFDKGGEGVVYYDQKPENFEKHQPPYGDGGVDLEWREEVSGKFNPGWTRAGEWRIYTVDVLEPGTYTIERMVACHKRGGQFRLEFNGVIKTGPVEIPDKGGRKLMKPFSKRGVKLEAGRYAMKLVLDEGGELRASGTSISSVS